MDRALKGNHMDMLGVMLRGMGIDPDALMAQTAFGGTRF